MTACACPKCGPNSETTILAISTCNRRPGRVGFERPVCASSAAVLISAKRAKFPISRCPLCRDHIQLQAHAGCGQRRGEHRINQQHLAEMLIRIVDAAEM